MSETPVRTGGGQARQDGPRSGTGALGFAGVLLGVLVVILVGSRTELTQTFALSGEPGTFTAQSCGRDIQYDGTTTRAQCVGEFTPDGGGEPFVAELYYDGDPGESYDARADPGSGTAHRTDLWSRWSALTLPLLPIAVLWLTLGVWWAFRRPGTLDRGQRRFLLLAFGVPTAALLLVCGGGFLVSVGIS